VAAAALIEMSGKQLVAATDLQPLLVGTLAAVLLPRLNQRRTAHLSDFPAVALLGPRQAGASWEGFAIDNILRAAPERTIAGFYRTGAGAEVDLVIDLPGAERWAIEVKRGLVPKLERGFHHARGDLRPARAFLVYSGDQRYPHSEGVDAIGLRDLCLEIASLRQDSQIEGR
jgi:predicted AAA+ superfamily ATPase